MQECPLYVWMANIYLDPPYVWMPLYKHMGHPNIQGVSKHKGALKHRGHPNIPEASKQIRGCPNIWGIQTEMGASEHMGASKHTGASKHMGVSKHTGGIQTYGGHQMYGAYGHPLSLTKHAFFVLRMYRGHPNIWGIQTYRGCPNIQGVDKCIGEHVDRK